MAFMDSVFVALFLLLVVFMVLCGLYLFVRGSSLVINKLDASFHKENRS